MWRAISAATASAATQRGPRDEPITSRARPPISAERTTFASATTAPGSEIVEHLLLSYTARLEVRPDLLRQTLEHLAAHLERQLGRVPGQEEAGRRTVARHKDHVLRAKHLARTITEVTNAHNPHVGTTVVTTGS